MVSDRPAQIKNLKTRLERLEGYFADLPVSLQKVYQLKDILQDEQIVSVKTWTIDLIAYEVMKLETAVDSDVISRLLGS